MKCCTLVCHSPSTGLNVFTPVRNRNPRQTVLNPDRLYFSLPDAPASIHVGLFPSSPELTGKFQAPRGELAPTGTIVT